ncbi:MAG: hypothetical protein M3220_08135, partial [Chloroflexota bacterium]|nr:hypothetical protein [Chloroflexota bacterium]
PISQEYLGHWGSYADEMRADAFATALRALLDNQHEWPAISTALRERAQTSFSWEAAGQQISEVYDLICD